MNADWAALVPDRSDDEVRRVMVERRAHAGRLKTGPCAAGLAEAADEVARIAVVVGPNATLPASHPYRATVARALDELRASVSAEGCAGWLGFVSAELSCGGGSRELLALERTWLAGLAGRDCGAAATTLGFAALAAGLPELTFAFTSEPFATRLASALLGGDAPADVRPVYEELVAAFPAELRAGRLSWTQLLLAARTYPQHFEKRGLGGIGAAAGWVRELAFGAPVRAIAEAPPPQADGVRIHVEGEHAETAITGEVRAVTPGASQNQRTVELATPGGGSARLHLVLPSGCEVPFAVAATIAVRVQRSSEGIHVITNACVTDAAGALLAAQLGSGDPGFAPGWEIAPEPSAAILDGAPGVMASSLTLGVRLSRGGATVVVRNGRWSRFEVGNETWLASGYAVVWGPGPRPPDASSYLKLEIVRVTGTALATR